MRFAAALKALPDRAPPIAEQPETCGSKGCRIFREIVGGLARPASRASTFRSSKA